MLLTDASLGSASVPGACNCHMLNRMSIDLKPTFMNLGWFVRKICLKSVYSLHIKVI